MIHLTAKNNELYKEFDADYAKYWFDRLDKKVLPNIDTLYCTARINEDYYTSELPLVLKQWQEQVNMEPYYIERYDCYMTGLSFANYRFCIEVKDAFLVCFMAKKSIETVPPIFIQIRSQLLWMVGEYAALQKVHDFINALLKDYGMTLGSIRENRIDFAYHTNYINNMTSFFRNINEMQVSRFSRGSKEFKLIGEAEEDVDYISIGRRKSNNIFIRIYNKTKEVIEQGYKQFFIEYWRNAKAISRYDEWIYAKCFEQKNYEYAYKARLEFYLGYGSNENYKDMIKEMLAKTTIDYEDLRELADKLTPPITLMTNIEFQTKRKFYYSLDESMGLLKSITDTECDALIYIYKLLDNKQLIHNLLTQDVFRLVKVTDNKKRKRDKETSAFWKLIQDVNLTPKGSDGKLLRSYQRELDVNAIKKRILNSLCSFGLYLDSGNKENVYADTMKFLAYLNESDLEAALQYKHKKAPSIQSRTLGLEKVIIDSPYALLDIETGAIKKE